MPVSAPTPPLQTWIGCLSCHNNGHLVGRWVDAIDADTVTITDLHRGREKRPYMAFCEELWCFDHELPQRGEMSPDRAAAWGERLAEINEEQMSAFLAWIHIGAHTVDADDLPIASDFEERYCGEWSSFQEYADEQVDALGVLDGLDENVARYFDFDSWARDLSYDYTTADAEGGGVFVFRNL